MNPLLERQLRKYVPSELQQNPDFKKFMDAVESSYNNYEDYLKMSQRAVKISSDELFEANAKLREEAESQKRILNTLDELVTTLKINSSDPEANTKEGIDLVSFIKEQATEIIVVNKQREELLHNLEQKNQVLSDYAHMVSHDLKSPLRSIDSLVNWIMEDNKDFIDDKCNNNFNLILQNLEKMDALINGILNYSTIDQAELESYDVDLNHLVPEIIQILFKPKHVEIIVKGEMPVVKGDKFRLQQLFQNLIQNAIKSIDKKKGIVEIAVKDLDSFWLFTVKDNGKGISREYHDKIFQIFEKIDNDQMATGIGLSIVKKIIDFYGGQIYLESEVGKGTGFYFTLPKK